MMKEVMNSKTHVLGELEKYAVYALSYLDKALHFKNPFKKWSFKTFIYKQILLRKYSEDCKKSHKQLIVSFGNWGNCDTII
jgi:hypothetical protein